MRARGEELASRSADLHSEMLEEWSVRTFGRVVVDWLGVELELGLGVGRVVVVELAFGLAAGPAAGLGGQSFSSVVVDYS